MRTIVKVDIQTYPILYKVGVYIYKSDSIAIRNWKISEYGSEHSKVMSKGNTGMRCWNMEQELELGLSFRLEYWGWYWWYLSSSMELSSGNLRSQSEAVIAVLQDSMSSKGGTKLVSKVMWVLWDVMVFPPQGSHPEILRYTGWVAYEELTGFCAQQRGLKQWLKLQNCHG